MPARILLAGTAAALLSGCAADAREAETPALELTGRVVDAADVLSGSAEERLNTKLEALENDTGVQLVVATTPSLGGFLIDDYSLDLANDWGIGSAERNDGLLLLVAPNERKVRIEVGRGLEASVKDEEAAEIIRDDIVPSFSKEDYDSGVDAGVDALIREVTPYELKEAA